MFFCKVVLSDYLFSLWLVSIRDVLGKKLRI